MPGETESAWWTLAGQPPLFPSRCRTLRTSRWRNPTGEDLGEARTLPGGEPLVDGVVSRDTPLSPDDLLAVHGVSMSVWMCSSMGRPQRYSPRAEPWTAMVIRPPLCASSHAVASYQ